MLVTIIIPCLSEPAVLTQCLDSLAKQSYPRALTEILVVDDASPVPLEDTFEQFHRDAPGFRTLHYLRNSKNIGRAATRNRGLAQATGDIVFFLDVDQTLAPDCLQELVHYFRPGHLLSVRANVCVPVKNAKRSAYLRYFGSRYLGARPASETARIDLNDLPAKFFATDAVAVSRSALESIGGFDERFTQYGCEDEELGIRLAELGVPFVFGQAAIVHDMDQRTTLRRACDRMTLYAQISLPLLLKKHPEYASMTTFAIFERRESFLSPRTRVLRRLLLALLKPWVGKVMVELLSTVDRIPALLQPPALLYQVSLTSYYLCGYRQRRQAVQP